MHAPARPHGKQLLTSNQSQLAFAGNYDAFETMPQDDAKAAFFKWLEFPDKGVKCPSILVSLLVVAFPCGNTGFPGRLCLIPFLPLCRQISKGIYERHKVSSLTPCNYTNILEYLSSRGSQYLLDRRETGLHGLNETGESHWMFNRAEPHEGDALWEDIAQPYLNSLTEQGSSESKTCESLLRLWEGVQNQVWDLMKDFEPKTWAHSFIKKKSEHKYEFDSLADLAHMPAALLKEQIVRLDILIQHILDILRKEYAPQMKFSNGLRGDESSNTFLSLVIKAISKAVMEAKDNVQPLEDLHTAFGELLGDTAGSKNIQEHIGHVADLLRLRIVLFAAYLMIIPDSSDIVEIRHSVGYSGFALPMI